MKGLYYSMCIFWAQSKKVLFEQITRNCKDPKPWEIKEGNIKIKYIWEEKDNNDRTETIGKHMNIARK